MEEEAVEYVVERATPFLDRALTRYVPRAYAAAASALGYNIARDQMTTRAPRFVTPPRRTGASRRRIGSTPRSIRSLRGPPTMAPTHTVTARGTMTRTRPSAYRNQLGRRVGAYKTRRTLWTGGKTDLQDKATYWSRLVSIQAPNTGGGETENTINRRTGELCKVVGVKLRYWFKIKDSVTSLNRPVQIRWAIINPKTQDGTSLTSLREPSDFFINVDPTNNMSQTFPATGTCFQYMNRKINREAYGVVKEGTFVMNLDPAGTSTARPGTSMKKLSVYIPIHRQLKWQGTISGSAFSFPEQNLYFVWWFVQMGDTGTARLYTTATTPVEESHEKLVYFQNSAMFR
jgi:hypothetical protein